MLEQLTQEYAALDLRVAALEGSMNQLPQLQADYAALELRVAALESSTADPFNGGDPDFGSLPIRHQRYSDAATMVADMHGTPAQKASGITSWDDSEKAVKLLFPNGQGSLYPQLRFGFNDGGASRVEWSIQVRHAVDWTNTAMATHKSFQLAVNGLLTFEPRDRYINGGNGIISYVDLREYGNKGIQPKGPADSLREPVGGDYTAFRKQRGVWYLYQLAIDYGSALRALSFSMTAENGHPVKIYDRTPLSNWFPTAARINEFWVEFNSSKPKDFSGESCIHVRDLQVRH